MIIALGTIAAIVGIAKAGQELFNIIYDTVEQNKKISEDKQRQLMNMSTDINVLNKQLEGQVRLVDISKKALEEKEKELKDINLAQNDLNKLNEISKYGALVSDYQNKARNELDPERRKEYNDKAREYGRQAAQARENAEGIKRSKEELTSIVNRKNSLTKSIRDMETVLQEQEANLERINLRITQVQEINPVIHSSNDNESNQNSTELNSVPQVSHPSNEREIVQTNILMLLDSELTKVTELNTKYSELLGVQQNIFDLKLDNMIGDLPPVIPAKSGSGFGQSETSSVLNELSPVEIPEGPANIQDPDEIQENAAKTIQANQAVADHKSALMDMVMGKMKKQTVVSAVLAAVEAIGSASSMPFPGNVISIGTSLSAVFAALSKATTEGKQIVAAAEGAVINKPTLLLAGEAMNRSGTEIVMPEKNFNRYMEHDIIPGILSKVNVNNTGTENRLDRVERAIYSIGNQIPGATGKAVKRALRGKL